jgi:hypothetical protein
MSAVSVADRDAAEKIAKGICKTYGFGETAEGEPKQSRAQNCTQPTTLTAGVLATGIFIFFVIFGVVMVLLQLIFGVARLGVESFVPKVLLVARAHSLSPFTVVRNAMACRYYAAHR